MAGRATTGTKPAIELSGEDARTISLRAQGLAPGDDPLRTPLDVLRRLGAVQLDTISVLARSHELVAYARLGACAKSSIETAYWGPDPQAFEFWAHANCVVPIEYWPYVAFRRRAARRRWPDTSGGAFDEIRARLRESPLTVSDAGGARDGAAGWWNWSSAKRALEVLYRTGEVAVTTRFGWKRVYDLAERAIPPSLRKREPDDAECYRFLVAEASRALGIGTARDIASYFMLVTPHAGIAPDARKLLAETIEQAGLAPVTVAGWSELAYADRTALNTTGDGDHHPPALLSPFDSLIWASTADAGSLTNGRERARRLFGFFYAFEAYKRPGDRIHGYFTMPLLARGNLIGRVDPARVGRTLVARYASLEALSDEGIADMASALQSAASWVGCEDVMVEETHPRALKRPLRAALK
jgi:uncharacterized protein YcaQ